MGYAFLNQIPRRWLQLGKSADQLAPGLNATITFDQYAGTIEYDPVTSIWTLPANKRFHLYANVGVAFTANSGSANFNFSDLTNLTTLVAAQNTHQMQVVPATYNQNVARGPGGLINGIYDIGSVPVRMLLYITAVNSVDRVYSTLSGTSLRIVEV